MRCLILLIALTGCSDDAGNVAFVHQAIPTVLGRKAKGGAEVRALVDQMPNVAAGTDPRDWVIDELVARPEYVDYWTLVLADALRVQRSGAFLPADSTCWGAPLLSDADEELLAAHIQTSSPGVAFGQEWNMTDAVRGAILADDLSVAWLAYLPAVAGSVHSEGDEDNAAKQFDKVYLNRTSDCLQCHSSSWSTVDEYDVTDDKPDRHFTSPWALEASVFVGDGTHHTAQWASGEDIYQNTDTYAGGLYTCQGCHGAAGEAPNQLNGYGDFTLNHRVPVVTDGVIRSQVLHSPDAGMPQFSLSDTELDDLVHYLRIQYGDHDDVKGYFRYETQRTTPDPAYDTPWGIAAACAPQFDTGVAEADGRNAGFAGQSTGSPDVHTLAKRLQGGLVGLDATIAAAPATVDAVDLPLLDGEQAYAYLVANAVADALFQHGTGTTSTVAHGFSRNASQLSAREDLVSDMVVGGTFSLVEPLKNTITFNLNAPLQSGEAPYWFGMYLNPWIADPVTNTGQNGVGDLVHRYDPNTLLFAVDDSLGWGPPSVFPDAAAAWPDDGLYRDLEAYQNDDAQGSPLWDMESVLAWENAAGPCVGPTADDYISDVMDAARADTAVPRLEVHDLFQTVRDRLLGTSTFGPGEEAVIANMLGVTTTQFDNGYFPSVAAQQTLVETGLRQYCGALLVSPDYTLAGIPTVTTAPPALRLEVCRDDGVSVERCKYSDLLLDYTPPPP
jgi:mono/diheme cytochrome c family protein